jgi:hypothetical protein
MVSRIVTLSVLVELLGAALVMVSLLFLRNW